VDGILGGYVVFLAVAQDGSLDSSCNNFSLASQDFDIDGGAVRLSSKFLGD
jgi:hypothetical protein